MGQSERNNFQASVRELLSGLDGFVSTRSVVGEPIRMGEATLIPLMYPEGVARDDLETFNVLRLIPESEYPPLIITTTPADELLYEEDLILEKALAERGRPYRFCSWPEKSNKLGHVFNVLFPELEESREANRAIVDFFRTQR